MNGFFYVRQQRSKDVIVEVIQIGFFTFGPFFLVLCENVHTAQIKILYIFVVFRHLQAGHT